MWIDLSLHLRFNKLQRLRTNGMKGGFKVDRGDFCDLMDGVEGEIQCVKIQLCDQSLWDHNFELRAQMSKLLLGDILVEQLSKQFVKLLPIQTALIFAQILLRRTFSTFWQQQQCSCKIDPMAAFFAIFYKYTVDLLLCVSPFFSHPNAVGRQESGVDSYQLFVPSPAKQIFLEYWTQIIVCLRPPLYYAHQIIIIIYCCSLWIGSPASIDLIKIFIKLQQLGMNDTQSLSRHSFHNQPHHHPFHQLRSQHFNGRLSKSQSKLFLQKLPINKTQIFQKQYTNKYFRNSNLYEDKENEKILHFNRLYTFIRKNKVANKLQSAHILKCKTEPHELIEKFQHHESIPSNNSFRINNKNSNNLSYQRPKYLSSHQNTEALFNEKMCNRLSPFHKLKQININTDSLNKNWGNEKISTSRALQKYAKLVRQDIFYSNKYALDKSFSKMGKHFCNSNIEARRALLYAKDLKHLQNKESRRLIKMKGIKKQKQVSVFLEDQAFDINGWETTAL